MMSQFYLSRHAGLARLEIMSAFMLLLLAFSGCRPTSVTSMGDEPKTQAPVSSSSTLEKPKLEAAKNHLEAARQETEQALQDLNQSFQQESEKLSESVKKTVKNTQVSAVSSIDPHIDKTRSAVTQARDSVTRATEKINSTLNAAQKIIETPLMAEPKAATEKNSKENQ